MNRRDFLRRGSLAAMLPRGLATSLTTTLALSRRATSAHPRTQESAWEAAARVLADATDNGVVKGASIFLRHRDVEFSRAFGSAQSPQAMFLLGSISKPITMTALMALHDRRLFQLDDLARKFFPEFQGDGRERVTVRHLLTHTSGLPDQLPNNDALRARHAPLGDFVAETLRVPLGFAPGTRYQYSSMGILLAARIAELLADEPMTTLVERTVFRPLGMTRSVQGTGKFQLADFVQVQTEKAAPESGGGSADSRHWDWNSRYWRGLGAPWGGTHASAPDIGRLLTELLALTGVVLRPETARLMVTNRNPVGTTPRGLGWNVGESSGSPGCSGDTFGHTGSTGTLAWADPRSQTVCVILTSLPGRAVEPHPRAVAGELVASAYPQP